jgi:predicted  nucleic acid-binding Zn-ribbon protein
MEKHIEKAEKVNALEEEIAELEHTSANLIEELRDVKNLEQDIKEKIKSIEK